MTVEAEITRVGGEEVVVERSVVDTVAGAAIHGGTVSRVQGLFTERMSHTVLVRVALAADVDRVLWGQERPLAAVWRVAGRTLDLTGVRGVPALEAGRGTPWIVAPETGRRQISTQHARPFSGVGIVARGTARGTRGVRERGRSVREDHILVAVGAQLVAALDQREGVVSATALVTGLTVAAGKGLVNRLSK